jgi:outer membrane lipopolysaccharide assembly protein LptE/RlpB
MKLLDSNKRKTIEDLLKENEVYQNEMQKLIQQQLLHKQEKVSAEYLRSEKTFGSERGS